MNIEERIEKLERRNSHLFVGLCALTLIAIFAYMSGNQPIHPSDLTIDASEFRLSDDSGNIRAVLAADEDNVGFMLFDVDENMRARLWVNGNESVSLDLLDPSGRANVTINARADGGIIGITDGNANLRYVCDVDLGGTAMLFFDDEMKPIWTAP